MINLKIPKNIESITYDEREKLLNNLFELVSSRKTKQGVHFKVLRTYNLFDVQFISVTIVVLGV